MGSILGKTLKLSLFGESHGVAIGAVIDGLPSGETFDFDALSHFLERRSKKTSLQNLTTDRKEDDAFEVLSGISQGKSNGFPLAFMIKNTDVRSSDYTLFRDLPRPSHSDYPALLRYGESVDLRGGGHFSGRITAALSLAGGLALQILEKRGVRISTHLLSIGSIDDEKFNPTGIDNDLAARLKTMPIPVINESIVDEISRKVALLKISEDSLGGSVEVCVEGFPSGLGSPWFGSLESLLSMALFAIPGLRGLAFGAGFEATRMKGSEHNDAWYLDEPSQDYLDLQEDFDNSKSMPKLKTKTNYHAGIIGGISTGMPLLFSLAFKPTPSIGLAQQTVSLSEKTEKSLHIQGRHDPCYVLRTPAVIEAVTALVLLDVWLSSGTWQREI